ncbi:hypothetical protein RZS28_00565 [Methylocapsa polymorpha]|uniref:Uncharacterized protein n=1 Tax=Methylocapsa polymorpha TaxID=3080828 RepID=A0ABZ0HRB8_9HYPH|nr:hypothetical protein RZS28_00565 [Methylocapsa sp. RX1]
MRTYTLATVVAALFAFPASGFSQQAGSGPGGVRMGNDQGQEASSQQECEQLRSMCFQKDELGQLGDDCRKYHASCKSVGAEEDED